MLDQANLATYQPDVDAVATGAVDVSSFNPIGDGGWLIGNGSELGRHRLPSF